MKEWDPNGNNPQNVKSEFLRVSDAPNKYRCVIPTHAPFFRTDLVLTDADGRELFEGTDYYLAYYYKEKSEALRRPIYGGFTIVADIDDVNVSRYRALGAEYSVSPKEATRHLVNPELLDPRSDDWSSVLKRRVDIKVNEPPKDIDEAIERDPVAKALNLIVESLKSLGLERSSNLTRVSDELSALVSQYNNELNIVKHTGDTGNYAHPLTTELVGAAKRSDKAPNSKTLYGLDKETSISNMRSFFLQYSDLDELVNRVSANIRGFIPFSEGVGVNANGGLSIIDDGSALTLRTNHNDFSVVIRPSVVGGRANLKLVCGTSIFTLNSLEDVCYINGDPVLTTKDAHIYLNPNLGAIGRVYVSDTPSVSISGTGTPNDPATANAIIRDATDQVIGKFNVYDNGSSQSVATAGYLYEIEELTKGRLPITSTINGLRLIDNPVLTKSSVGLSRVNNTSPSQKPLNTKFSQELAKKSNSTHTHEGGDIEIYQRANENIPGYSKFGNLANTSISELAYKRDLEVFKTRLDDINVGVGGTINSAVLRGYVIRDLEIEDIDGTIVVSDFTIDYFIYSDRITGDVFRDLEGTVCVEGTELVVGNNGIRLFSRVGGVLEVYGDFRYDYSRSWLEHTNSAASHRAYIERGYYNLLDNYPPSYFWDNPHTNPLPDWLRWSHHKDAISLPANPTDLQHWMWDDGFLSLEEPTNTTTMLISTTPMDRYNLDIVSTFTSEFERGAVVFVIAAWGDEETLSLVIRHSPSEGEYGVAIYYNYSRVNESLVSVISQSPLYSFWPNVIMRLKVTVGDELITLDLSSGYLSDKEGEYLKQNIEYLDLYTRSRTISISELPSSFSEYTKRYGFGARSTIGFKFLDLTVIGGERSTYPLQGALRSVAENQTVEFSHTKTDTAELDLELADGGLYVVELTSPNVDIELVDNYPHTLERNIFEEKEYLYIKLLNTNPENGNQLYELPQSLKVKLSFFTVDF